MFSRTAAQLVFEATYGVPRLVNQLCDLALLYAYSENKHSVPRLTVQRVLDDGVFFAGGLPRSSPVPAPGLASGPEAKP